TDAPAGVTRKTIKTALYNSGGFLGGFWGDQWIDFSGAANVTDSFDSRYTQTHPGKSGYDSTKSCATNPPPCWGSKGGLLVRAGTGNCGSNCGPVGHSGCVGISDFSCNGTLLTGNILGGCQSQASQDSVNIVNNNSALFLTNNVTINGAAWTAPNCTGTTVPCTTGYETNKICVGSGCSGTPSKQITGT